MTTIRQMITSSPMRANELFAKLVDTSETAVKTRDRLFSELKVELDRQAEMEELHLFPALKKHKETKALVADALDDNRLTRKLLAELEGTAKDSEAFTAKVAELRTVFQQHVRDDRKEFLPAVIKALSDEEANAVVEKVETETAQIEATQRAEADARRADAKREREASEAASAAKDKAEAAHAAKVEAKADAERARKDADAAEAKAATVARKREQATEQARSTDRADAERDAVEAEGRPADIVKAGAKMARIATKTDGDEAVEMNKSVRVATGSWAKPAHDSEATSAGSLLSTLLGEQSQHAMQAAMAAGRAKTLAEFVKAQSDFVGGSLERMGRFNERYLALMTGGVASAIFPQSRR